MSLLNKLAPGPGFTFLILTLLILPNISLGATTATLSHNGGDIWVVGQKINFTWNSGAARVDRVVVERFESRDGERPNPDFPLRNMLQGYLLDSSGSGIGNPPPGVPATKSGSFSWTIRMMPRSLENNSLSQPFYIRLLTYPSKSPYGSPTPDAKSSWMGPYQTLSSDACSITTEVSSGNGTITPPTGTIWAKGQTKIVTFTPNAGYQILTAVFPQPHGVKPSACIQSGTGACIPVATSGTGALTKTLSCDTGTQYKAKVTFGQIPGCPVRSQIVSTGGKVTLVPTAPVTTVAPGQALQVKAESNPGYKIKEFKVRGYDNWFNQSNATGKATSTQILTCPSDQKALGYDVAFELANDYKIISSQIGAGGTITPLGETALAKDKKQEYVIKPEAGYVIEELKIDGVVDTKYTGQSGITSGRDRGQTPKISITLGYINETKNPRTISVKFAPACKLVTPAQTLSDIKAGKETWINRDSFRTWVGENRELVKSEIIRQQCTPGGVIDDLGGLEPNQLNHIYPSLDRGVSSHAFFDITGRIWRTSANGEVTTDNIYHGIPHALIVTGVTKFNTGAYSVGYLDSNGPTKGILSCREESYNVDGALSVRLRCPLNSYYSNSKGISMGGGVFKPEYLYIGANSYIEAKNTSNSRLPIVRSNSIIWLNNNYTQITNFSTPESTGGICTGWSDFNIKASLLIKECIIPKSAKTSFNTKEDISFLNQVAVKKTLADKYLAQLALLWQIDDVVIGWWQRIVK